MKKNIKKAIGNMAINLGKHAIGKSMIAGMYDPQIPDILKMNKKEKKEDKELPMHYDNGL